jgi:calcium-dependent protein kinase
VLFQISHTFIKYQKKIVHRDAKPENILISNKNFTNVNEINIKLTDFGKSTFLGNKKKSGGKIAGTPLYLAPEVIEGKFDYKCDLWSTGVLCYNMLCGMPPFTGKEYEVIYKIVRYDFEFTFLHSEQARNFILRLMNRNPKARPEVKQILTDPWLQPNDQEHNTEQKQTVNFDMLANMSKFVTGKNLKRSVLSYILSKKLYIDNKNDLLKLFKEIDKDGNGHITSE